MENIKEAVLRLVEIDHSNAFEIYLEPRIQLPNKMALRPYQEASPAISS